MNELEPEQACLRVAQPCGPTDDPLQDDGEFTGVGADEAQHLAGGGLQLQRLGQVGVAFLDLSEEASVVDGDRCLVRKGLEQ